MIFGVTSQQKFSKQQKSSKTVMVNCFRCSVIKLLCKFMCVSPTAEAEFCCLFPDPEENSEDQAKLIVGVVAGLLIAAAVVGLIYWLYMRNSRYRNTHISILHLYFRSLLSSGGTALAS